MIPFGGDCQAAAGDELVDLMAGIEADSALEVPDLPSGNQQFYHLIQPVLDQHERIQGAYEAVGMARETIGIAKGALYPNLHVKGGWGYRNEDKTDDTDDFSDSFGNLTLGLEQRLYDFGKTSASIEQSRLELIGQELTLRQTRSQLILDAAAAYQNLHKTYRLLDFAIEAEKTASDKVEREKGRAMLIGQQTDLRELEYQLVETVSKRVQCEGNYQLAQNIWLEFFSALPKNIEALKPLELSYNVGLPQSLDEALGIAQSNNMDIRIARNQQNTVELTLKYEKKNAFLPDINLVMDGSFENNLRDNTGKMDTYKAMVECRKDINLGLADLHRIGAAKRLVRKERYEMADQLRIVETTTRNAWHSLKTTEIYTETLAHQAILTADLLDMARREHETGGDKTIMDVLAGETNLINARSASYAAQVDISLAALNLLGAMGTLDIEMFAGEEEPESEESTEPNDVPFLDYTRFLNSYKLYDNIRRNQSGGSVFQCAYDGQSGYYELFNVGQ
jgi:adhesin transport system outer membrane protein